MYKDIQNHSLHNIIFPYTLNLLSFSISKDTLTVNQTIYKISFHGLAICHDDLPMSFLDVFFEFT